MVISRYQKIDMRLLLIVIFICLSYTTVSQTYVSASHSLTNIPGTIADKSNLSIEVGRQWDVFSVGFDYGKTSLGNITGKDTTQYIEIRPNLNIFQQGKFSNTITAGIGYVFGTEQSLLTEFTSGIEYAYTPTLHFNVMFGQFYYSGFKTSSTETFFGVSVMYFFKPYHPQSIIKQNN